MPNASTPESTAEDALVAPVAPTAGAHVRLRPIGLRAAEIDAGFWAERRATNRAVTIPHGADRLRAAGNLANFELAAAGETSGYRGEPQGGGSALPFLDSDVYKWLEAVAWEAARDPDPAPAALAEPMIELIEKAQRSDGYIDTFFQVAQPGEEFRHFNTGHELYVAGHLVQAAVAWRRVLADDRLLVVARRFVDRIDAELGAGRREIVCGHPEFEMALVELYRVTGEDRYLELAKLLVERRGRGLLGECSLGTEYWQDHEPVRTAARPAGHAVRQMYLDCGVVDVAVETGDRELLDSVVRRWESMVSAYTYITGGLGAHHRDEAFGDPFELPPDRAYTETCAAIGSVMLSWRLLLATGESRFADLLERTVFNAVLPGLALDGAHYFYTNPLLRRSGATAGDGRPRAGRSEWFGCACCPPNLMRLLAQFPDFVATSNGSGVQVHQYVSGAIEARAGGGKVRIETRTRYPWEGTVEVTVARSVAEPWTLSLRVPAWCAAANVEVAGADGRGVPDADRRSVAGPTTIDLTRIWRPGDAVTLTLDMPVRVVAPDPRIDAVRGSLALERGPLVYAVEDADLAPGESIESLEIATPPNPAVETRTEPGLGEMTWLSFDGFLRADDSDAGWPYRDPSAASGAAARPARPVRARALPYFAWANRAGLGMRVWIPVHEREG